MSALLLPLLAATAASGKPNRRKNLDMEPAALGYREMGRSWTTLSWKWGAWAGLCPHAGSWSVFRTGHARALVLLRKDEYNSGAKVSRNMCLFS